MKFYTLTGKVAGQDITTNRHFKTRDEAINYFFNYSDKKYVFDLEVEDEFIVNNDVHDIRYVCNKNSFFTVNRVLA